MKSASPGIGIAKVWQGQLELVLRGVIVLCSNATLITSTLALDYVKDNFPSSAPAFLNNIIEEMDYNTLFRNSTTAAKIGIALACFVLVYEIILIIIRLVNIGLINIKIKIFLGIDVTISCILFAVFGLVGILAAHSASKLADIVGDVQLFRDRTMKTQDLLAALAGTSLIGALLMALLVMWLILFLFKGWNSRILLKNEKGSVLS